MKIEHRGGAITDTEKVTNDVTAAVLEKTKEYMEFLSKYKVPFYLRYTLPNETYSGAFSWLDQKKTPEDTRIHLMMDCIQFWEAESGLRIVAMPPSTFNLINEQGIDLPEQKDY